jgi:hypothetical protein
MEGRSPIVNQFNRRTPPLLLREGDKGGEYFIEKTNFEPIANFIKFRI